MLFHSTNRRSSAVTFRDAVLQGLAPDGGLWMMDTIPTMSDEWFASLPTLSFTDIAYAVSSMLIGEDVDASVLREIVDATFTFPVPLKKIDDHTSVLELFHGPTLAFKDFGARFMARVMGHLAATEKRELTILVATSGDTGGAVADAFKGVANTRVFILYPKGRVTPMQERQFTTVGGNITAIEVDGTFDDCQALVKQAFLDAEVNAEIQLASANSINIARLIPQSFYYFAAVAAVPHPSLPIVFSVPSGNFGNLTAGLIAKKMGLPVAKFIAATNANNVVPDYLRSGTFQPRASVATISNAMDVGNPSNFSRMTDLYDNDVEKMRRDIVGYEFTDEETLAMMRQCADKNDYILDPHGAVAMLGLRAYPASTKEPVHGIALATAHPAKFAVTVEKALGKAIDIPAALAVHMEREKIVIPLENSLQGLKEVLMG